MNNWNYIRLTYLPKTWKMMIKDLIGKTKTLNTNLVR